MRTTTPQPFIRAARLPTSAVSASFRSPAVHSSAGYPGSRGSRPGGGGKLLCKDDHGAVSSLARLTRATQILSSLRDVCLSCSRLGRSTQAIRHSYPSRPHLVRALPESEEDNEFEDEQGENDAALCRGGEEVEAADASRHADESSTSPVASSTASVTPAAIKSNIVETQHQHLQRHQERLHRHISLEFRGELASCHRNLALEMVRVTESAARDVDNIALTEAPNSCLISVISLCT
jgi:hypothetical protein